MDATQATVGGLTAHWQDLAEPCCSAPSGSHRRRRSARPHVEDEALQRDGEVGRQGGEPDLAPCVRLARAVPACVLVVALQHLRAQQGRLQRCAAGPGRGVVETILHVAGLTHASLATNLSSALTGLLHFACGDGLWHGTPHGRHKDPWQECFFDRGRCRRPRCTMHTGRRAAATARDSLTPASGWHAGGLRTRDCSNEVMPLTCASSS